MSILGRPIEPSCFEHCGDLETTIQACITYTLSQSRWTCQMHPVLLVALRTDLIKYLLSFYGLSEFIKDSFFKRRSITDKKWWISLFRMQGASTCLLLCQQTLFGREEFNLVCFHIMVKVACELGCITTSYSLPRNLLRYQYQGTREICFQWVRMRVNMSVEFR